MTTLTTPTRPNPTPARGNGTPPPSLRDLDLETLIALYPPKMEPMGEAIIHLFSFVRIIEILNRWFGELERKATVFGDVMVYYRDERGEVASLAPDICVVFDVDPERIDEERSYFIERAGKVPALVMEIASDKTARRDMYQKPAIYAHIGVGEYWMLDPTGGDHYGFPLRGLRLVDGAYEEIEQTTMADGSVRAFSDALELELRWENADLRFFDPASGEYLRTPEEIQADEREAQARARDLEDEVARLRKMLGI